MEQPMFSLTSYHGERKLAWKRICNRIPFSPRQRSLQITINKVRGSKLKSGRPALLITIITIKTLISQQLKPDKN